MSAFNVADFVRIVITSWFQHICYLELLWVYLMPMTFIQKPNNWSHSVAVWNYVLKDTYVSKSPAMKSII